MHLRRRLTKMLFGQLSSCTSISVWISTEVLTLCLRPISLPMQGKYLVLAGLKGMNGQLEFVSGEDMEVLDAAEHFLATEIEWDPTGRYVATAVTALQKMENGLHVRLFNGQLVYR